MKKEIKMAANQLVAFFTHPKFGTKIKEKDLSGNLPSLA
jgi:hypothetical protein